MSQVNNVVVPCSEKYSKLGDPAEGEDDPLGRISIPGNDFIEDCKAAGWGKIIHPFRYT